MTPDTLADGLELTGVHRRASKKNVVSLTPGNETKFSFPDGGERTANVCRATVNDHPLDTLVPDDGAPAGTASPDPERHREGAGCRAAESANMYWSSKGTPCEQERRKRYPARYEHFDKIAKQFLPRVSGRHRVRVAGVRLCVRCIGSKQHVKTISAGRAGSARASPRFDLREVRMERFDGDLEGRRIAGVVRISLQRCERAFRRAGSRCVVYCCRRNRDRFGRSGWPASRADGSPFDLELALRTRLYLPRAGDVWTLKHEMTPGEMMHVRGNLHDR
ncbi:hypothetical protein [Burkholderia ubonensis]|uniref:hypothetical protein n=1 Tax=Burkholderia ubonensis TaxID=101571 RepID=UPI000AA9D375|nr:hypothetical protein [Burkholderia ubonensis]